MKSVQFNTFGDATQVLQVLDVPVPTPTAGQFRVRLTARPINPSDLLNVMGIYGTPPALPAIAGFEGVGQVDAVGEGVPDYMIGHRVYVLNSGTWQEQICVPAASTIPIPQELPDDIACQLIVNPVSAYAMLDELKLAPGAWLLQTGGSSALGQMLVQLARRRGIRTISTVRRDDMIPVLEARGADVVVNTTREDLVARVKEVTQGRGVAGALEAVGGTLGAQALECLARSGTMLVYGVLGLEPIPVNSGLMLFKNLTMKGFWLNVWMATTRPERRQEVVNEVMGLLSGGEIAPPIEARYSLDQVREACAHAARPGRNGKILLVG